MQVGEQETAGVADAAVGVGALFQDVIRKANFSAVVGRRYPEAKDVRAEGVDDFLRFNHVAERFAHFAAAFVNGEAVSEQAFVGRVAVDGAASEQ